jgi:hypothetical protein
VNNEPIHISSYWIQQALPSENDLSGAGIRNQEEKCNPRDIMQSPILQN